MRRMLGIVGGLTEFLPALAIIAIDVAAIPE
jgi:hypothetical protein